MFFLCLFVFCFFHRIFLPSDVEALCEKARMLNGHLSSHRLDQMLAEVRTELRHLYERNRTTVDDDDAAREHSVRERMRATVEDDAREHSVHERHHHRTQQQQQQQQQSTAQGSGTEEEAEYEEEERMHAGGDEEEDGGRFR